MQRWQTLSKHWWRSRIAASARKTERLLALATSMEGERTSARTTRSEEDAMAQRRPAYFFSCCERGLYFKNSFLGTRLLPVRPVPCYMYMYLE